MVYIQYLFHYTVLFSLLFSVIQHKKIIICPRGSFSEFTLSNKLTFIKNLWLFLFIKPFVNQIVWQASSYLEERDIKKKFPATTVEIINDGVDFQSFQVYQEIPKIELVNRYSNRTANRSIIQCK